MTSVQRRRGRGRFCGGGADRGRHAAGLQLVAPLRLAVGHQRPGLDAGRQFHRGGLLIVGGAIGLGRSLPNERGGTWGPRLLGLFGLSLIVAGLFSTDPAMGYPADAPAKSPVTLHGLIHGLNAPVCFGLLTASAIVLGRHFLGYASSRWFGGVSLGVAAIVVLSFIGATVFSVMDETGAWPNAPTGLVQRIGIGAGWFWFAAVAIRQSRLCQQLMRRVVEVAKSSSLEWTPTR
jgi:Protein of unknown function (DUF998)